MSKMGKIGFLVAALCFVVAAAVRFILGAWIPFLYLLIALAAAALVLSLISDRKLYLEFFTLRTTKHGMNMGVLILLVTALLVCVNYLSVRHNKTFDLTVEKINSLSEQSQKVLKSLESDLTVKVFFKGADALPERQEVTQTLNVFREYSSRVKIQFIDAYVDNALAQEYLAALPDRDQAPVFVFVEYGGKRIRVEPGFTPPQFGEEQVAQALVKATRKEEMKVYFLTGHGERELVSESQQGLLAFKQELESASYVVEELSLFEKAQVPADASIVMVIGPKKPLLEGEITVLKNYLSQGGRMVIALDPGEQQNLSPLVRELGVDFKNNFVIFLDPTKGQASGTSLGLVFDKGHPVTSSLVEGKTLTLFDLTSELTVDAAKPESIRVSELVKTSPNSFLMKELKTEVTAPAAQKSYSIFMEAQGKLTSQAPRDFKAIIVGDSDFVTNRLFLVGSNRDLTMNAVAELSDQKDLISIRPRQSKGTQLILTGPARLAMITAGVSLPVLLLLMSGVFWYRRRGA